MKTETLEKTAALIRVLMGEQQSHSQRHKGFSSDHQHTAKSGGSQASHREACGPPYLPFASELCRQFGMPLPRSGTMTDVASHGGELATVLARGGVKFMHVGCNWPNGDVRTPGLFWREGPDGSRVLTFYSSNYGTARRMGWLEDWGADTLCSGLRFLPPADWPVHCRGGAGRLRRSREGTFRGMRPDGHDGRFRASPSTCRSWKMSAGGLAGSSTARSRSEGTPWPPPATEHCRCPSRNAASG